MTAYQWWRQIIAETSESDRSSSLELTHHQLHWCMTTDNDSLSVMQTDHCWNQWKWQIFITGTDTSSHWYMTIDDDSLSVVQTDHCWNQWKWQIFITGTDTSSVTLMHDHWWQLISGTDRSLLKPVKVTDHHSGKITSCHHWRNLMTLMSLMTLSVTHKQHWHSWQTSHMHTLHSCDWFGVGCVWGGWGGEGVAFYPKASKAEDGTTTTHEQRRKFCSSAATLERTFSSNVLLPPVTI